MSYDPKVWTFELPPMGQAKRPWWIMRDDGPGYDSPGREVHWSTGHRNSLLMRRVRDHGWARSILPIPSAEEIAALVECERVLRDAVAGAPTVEPVRYEGDNHGDSFSSGWDSGEFYLAKKLRAALARLDEARKERGA